MAAYADLATIASSSTFQSRVAAAMGAVAATIYAQSNPNQTARNFAINVAQGKYSLSACALIVVNYSEVVGDVTGGPTDTTITDAHLLDAVTNLWNLMAGA